MRERKRERVKEEEPSRDKARGGGEGEGEAIRTIGGERGARLRDQTNDKLNKWQNEVTAHGKIHGKKDDRRWRGSRDRK